MLDRPQRPFFRRGESRIDEGFTQINLPAVAQVFGEPLQELVQTARPLPELEPSMAGLIRRIARREIVPWGAGAQDPEHAVQHGARIRPRPPATVGPTARPKRRFEHSPLSVGQVHAVAYDGDPTNVSGRDLYI